MLRAELKQVTGRFQSAVAASEMALRAARETTQRVLQAIADGARQEPLRQGGSLGTGLRRVILAKDIGHAAVHHP